MSDGQEDLDLELQRELEALEPDSGSPSSPGEDLLVQPLTVEDSGALQKLGARTLEHC
jgi:hypothetical protein